MGPRTHNSQATIRRIRIQLSRSSSDGLTVALPIFLTGVLISLVEWLISTFLRSKSWDWRPNLAIFSVLSVGWFIVSFISSYADLRTTDSLEKAAYPVFGADGFSKLIYGGAGVLALFMSEGLYHEGDPLHWQAMPLGMLWLVWYCWPRSIYLCSDSLAQRTRWGRMKRLKYTDVEYASYSRAEHQTLVMGGEIEIVHSSQHVDPSLFQELVEKHTGKQVYGAE
jgi:hypothetical protein